MDREERHKRGGGRKDKEEEGRREGGIKKKGLSSLLERAGTVRIERDLE